MPIDFDAFKQHYQKKRANKFPDHPTEKQYENNASYFEGGEPKFPIREQAPKSVVEKDIHDARKLEHHVSPEDQAKVEHHIEEVENKRDIVATQNDINMKEQPNPAKDKGFKPAENKDFENVDSPSLGHLKQHLDVGKELEQRAHIGNDLLKKAHEFLFPGNQLQNSQKYQSPEVAHNEKSKRGRVVDPDHDRRLSQNKDKSQHLDIHELADEKKEEEQENKRHHEEEMQREHQDRLERLREALTRARSASKEEKFLRSNASMEVSNFVNTNWTNENDLKQLALIHSWLQHKIANAASINEKNEFQTALSNVATLMIQNGALNKQAVQPYWQPKYMREKASNPMDELESGPDHEFQPSSTDSEWCGMTGCGEHYGSHKMEPMHNPNPTEIEPEDTSTHPGPFREASLNKKSSTNGFDDAIAKGRLSANPKDENFAGHFMDMGGGKFKHTNTRSYLSNCGKHLTRWSDGQHENFKGHPAGNCPNCDK